ncbi:MAG: ribonuclease E/G [Chlamydiia bacterium]|nr:ribonuclease E/G [Chlamydiia bacterium]
MNELLLNVESKEIRCAHLRNGQLYDLTVERKNKRRLTGNIYRGRVTNILENIQSAFIDIGEGDNGFIHISDILENTKKFEEQFDLDFDNEPAKGNGDKKDDVDIEEILKKDQTVLVQVVKEPIGNKGARLTSNISVAGRYLVLLPNSNHRGVSRKIEDRMTREKLKKLIRSFEMPNNMGLICRTASRVATEEMLIEEAHGLLESWQNIVGSFNATEDPKLLFEESDLIKRSVMTAIDKRYDRLLVDDYPTYQICKQLVKRYSGEHNLRLELYRDKVPMFERFNVEREVEKTLRRKIWLPHGGYIFFERTEAMYTVDVNSGRSSIAESDVEESLVRINLEAAEEVARQLRLRNVGGLIVIDFIDMRLRKSQRRVLEKLKECLKEDSAKCRVLGMSEFGLVEMTRQRSRGSLTQLLYTECPYCHGQGMIKSLESMAIQLERTVKKAITCHQQYGLQIVVHPELYNFMQGGEFEYLNEFAEGLNARLEWTQNDELHLNDLRVVSTVSNQVIEV